MCLLGLSSVLKGHILSFYPDVGDFNYKHLFSCHITPRTVVLTKSASEYCFVTMNHLVLSSSLPNFSQIILHHCYPQFRKERKVIQVTTVQLQKKFV